MSTLTTLRIIRRKNVEESNQLYRGIQPHPITSLSTSSKTANLRMCTRMRWLGFRTLTPAGPTRLTASSGHAPHQIMLFFSTRELSLMAQSDQSRLPLTSKLSQTSKMPSQPMIIASSRPNGLEPGVLTETSVFCFSSHSMLIKKIAQSSLFTSRTQRQDTKTR